MIYIARRTFRSSLAMANGGLQRTRVRLVFHHIFTPPNSPWWQVNSLSTHLALNYCQRRKSFLMPRPACLTRSTVWKVGNGMWKPLQRSRTLVEQQHTPARSLDSIYHLVFGVFCSVFFVLGKIKEQKLSCTGRKGGKHKSYYREVTDTQCENRWSGTRRII